MDWLQTIIEFFKDVLALAKPDRLREVVQWGGAAWVGYAILGGIIFAETGLLVGFFLPGDSLLFAAGALASQDVFNIFLLQIVLIPAAIVGDAINYHFGKLMGQQVFEKGRLKYVKHEHLLQARAFYERHGVMSIVLARFIPIVRTFTPFVAGVAQMSYPLFAFYNIIGGIFWVTSMTFCGYFLFQIPFVAKNFELFVIGIVVLSVLPVIFGFIQSWWSRRPKVAMNP